LGLRRTEKEKENIPREVIGGKVWQGAKKRAKVVCGLARVSIQERPNRAFMQGTPVLHQSMAQVKDRLHH
jgi:hypothetical protein